jgi:peptidyl-prolyl cis-trans isomerase C
MKISKQLKNVILFMTMNVCVFSHAQNAVIVNGTPIPSAKLDRLIEQSGQPNTPDVRAKARDVLITKELVNQEASKRGLIKNPEVQDALEQARLSVLVSVVFEDWISKDGMTDKDMQASYDAMKGQLGGKEYKASHILVSDEKLAKSLLTQIKAGANFAQLAKSFSIDKGSAVNGGSLDWVSPNSLVPEFAKAMSSLSAGQVYQLPVKTQFGWHIIEVNEVREQPVPTLAEIKPQIMQMLAQDKNWQKQKFTEMMESFKAKAKIQ